MIIIICIGSTKIIGDSLGPLIGTKLKSIYSNCNKIKVYGDLNNQINYYNIDYVLNEIKRKYENCIKIIIDSGLGNDVGSYIVNRGELILGHSLNKTKVAKGDVNIIGTVGKNHYCLYENLLELKKVDINLIYRMVNEITNAIQKINV